VKSKLKNPKTPAVKREAEEDWTLKELWAPGSPVVHTRKRGSGAAYSTPVCECVTTGLHVNAQTSSSPAAKKVGSAVSYGACAPSLFWFASSVRPILDLERFLKAPLTLYE
jgi:hypothetical protein